MKADIGLLSLKVNLKIESLLIQNKNLVCRSTLRKYVKMSLALDLDIGFNKQEYEFYKTN